MSKQLFGALLLLISFKPSAQNLFEGEYILFGLGGQIENFKDDFVSPLIYQGYSGAAGIGWHSQHGAWQNNFDGHIAVGLQSPRSLMDVDNQTTTVSGSINYSLRYRVIKEDKHALFLGLSSANLIGFRRHSLYRNSALSFSNFFSYGLSASWQFQPKLSLWGNKVPLAWQSELNFPLASYLIMPGYTRQSFNDESGFKSHRFIGDFWHLELRHNLVYPLKNGNQIRLSYHWNYAELNSLNYLSQAQHYLMIHLMFKL